MPNLPARLSEANKAHNAVCELLESEVLSPDTKFYLAQLREVLEAEIAALKKQTSEAATA